jgi:hypothetical protein
MLSNLQAVLLENQFTLMLILCEVLQNDLSILLTSPTSWHQPDSPVCGGCNDWHVKGVFTFMLNNRAAGGRRTAALSPPTPDHREKRAVRSPARHSPYLKKGLEIVSIRHDTGQRHSSPYRGVSHHR